MKVLFLDIDGVLKDDNYIRYVNNHFDEYMKKDFLLEDKFKILSEICKKYDLKVVVSSAWKCDESKVKSIKDVEEDNPGLYELHSLLNKYGIELYGYTPDVPNPGKPWCQYMCKEYDIEAFLIDHPEVTHYVIVDDVSENDIYTLQDHLLKTKFDEDGLGNGGLLPHHIDDIKEFIKPREEVIPEKMEDNPLYKKIKYSEVNVQDFQSFGLFIDIGEVKIHISLSFDKSTVFYHWYDEYEYKRGVLHNYDEFLDLLRYFNIVDDKENIKKLERKV